METDVFSTSPFVREARARYPVCIIIPNTRATMEAFHSSDLEKANATIGQTKNLEERCCEVNRMALSFEAAHAIHFVYIADSIQRMGDYSTDICEHTINHIVGSNV